MRFWVVLLIQLALTGVEFLVKMLHRRLDAKEKAKKAAAAAAAGPVAEGEPPADFREELLSQVKRLQETTKAYRKKSQP
ncbi:MAG TPA: hypothetical protein VLH09_06800 [Bryobacteraceae bacterium]|nr:hypothetical protein [Bryobacteraceae bacterium]